MNRFDRSDRNARPPQEGFWKRPTQRWSGQEHYHLSHPDHYHHHGKSDLSRGSPYRESPLGHFESYGGTPFFQAQKMFVDVPENTVILDEMTLRHMVQDCTSVKTQLLKLKRLLHQHDGSGSLHDVQLSLPSSPEPEDGDQIYKNEDLLNEIKQLKEEIKKKDEKIQLLEHQLATQCHCHQKSKEEKCTYADKYTQTPWRRIPGGYSAPSFSPWQGSFPGIPRTVPPHRRQSESVPLTPILLWLPVYGIALLHAPSSPAPPLPSTVTCRHVLSRHSWLSSLINAPLTACGRLLLRALGELSGVSFTLMLFTPVARDPRPIDMHLFLMRVLFS
uniref:Coiled-coil serine rich protein 2 n=1 Tax=Equus asinus TaxID=9793 RepID=A0A9L0ILK1_EQUAS